MRGRRGDEDREQRHTTTNATMSPQHATCPQPCEQLLVGWVVGGTMMGRGDDMTDQHRHVTTTHHRASLLMGWANNAEE